MIAVIVASMLLSTEFLSVGMDANMMCNCWVPYFKKKLAVKILADDLDP